MNIVQLSPGDIGMREEAALVPRCTKTLRRAVSAGQLPERYVLGPRGLGLVFAREDLERWRAEPAHHRSGRPRGRTATAKTDGTLPALRESLSGIRANLGAARAIVDGL